MAGCACHFKHFTEFIVDAMGNEEGDSKQIDLIMSRDADNILDMSPTDKDYDRSVTNVLIVWNGVLSFSVEESTNVSGEVLVSSLPSAQAQLTLTQNGSQIKSSG